MRMKSKTHSLSNPLRRQVKYKYALLRGRYGQIYAGYTICDLHRMQRDNGNRWDKSKNRWIFDAEYYDAQDGITLAEEIASQYPAWMFEDEDTDGDST